MSDTELRDGCYPFHGGPRCERVSLDPYPDDLPSQTDFLDEPEEKPAECVQCGAPVRRKLGARYRTGAVTCRDCHDADFG